MKTTLNFEDKETKLLLAKLNFQYFLDRNIEEENYNINSVEQINLKHLAVLKELRKKHKKNTAQFRFYLEGQVRKMFTGGFLPAIFHLDESRKQSFSDFEAIGENWAYFDLWQRLYKRKILLDKAWEIIIKTGSLLGIALSIIKLIEVLHKR